MRVLYAPRLPLVLEVAYQADQLYQMLVVQDDPEGAAEVRPHFEKAVERLRAFDKELGITPRFPPHEPPDGEFEVAEEI